MTDQARRPRAALVHNPVKIDVETLRPVLADLEREHGWDETLVLETSVEDPGQAVARQALEEGADVVIAAGGDGTVRAVAEALRGSGRELALLPAGTGNLLARNLDLPLDDPAESLRIAFAGGVREIDAALLRLRREDGTSEDLTFVVMAGMGLDARMLSETDDDLKARAGWLAYVKAIVTVLRDPNELSFRFRLDENPPRHVKAHTVIVGNCGTLPADILLLPDAALDDGLLDIVALRPHNLAGWVQVLTKVIWENGIVRRLPWAPEPLPSQALVYSTARELDVRLDSPQEVEVDGDHAGHAVGLRVRVDPGALHVKVADGR